MPREPPVPESATSPALVAEARALIEEYSRGIGFSLDFQDFARELESLPGEYAPPRGALFLARIGARYAGCVGLRPLDEVTCEMKRLFVRPEFRDRGIGALLARHLVAEGRRLGYRRMRLDTVPSMTAALGLYRRLGFREIPAYRYNPMSGAVYLELELDTVSK